MMEVLLVGLNKGVTMNKKLALAFLIISFLHLK